ncbi:MAG: RNase P modulator RnpM [Desulfotomaculales bacterium]
MAARKKIPLRMCVGCTEMKPKRELIRIVRTVEDTIEIDRTGKRAGRGAYVCPLETCLEQAVKGRRLEKALRHKIDKDLVTYLREELSKRASDNETSGSGPTSG